MDGEGIIQVSQVDDHAHGRQPVHCVSLGGIPARGVDDGFAAARAEWPAVEQRFDRGDAGHAQGLVGKNGGMQVAPVPFGGVPAFQFFHLSHSLGEGTQQDVVSRLHLVRRRPVVPPGSLRLQNQVPDHFVPAGAARGPVVLWQVVIEGIVQQVLPEYLEHGRGCGIHIGLAVPILKQVQRKRLVGGRRLEVQLPQERHERGGVGIIIVALHFLDIGDIDAGRCAFDQGSDPVGAEAVIPVAADQVRVTRPDNRVVGSDDIPLRWVKHVR